MESFTRRVDAEDESDTTEFSTISSDNGFVSSEELRSEAFSNDKLGDGVLSDNSSGSMSTSPKRMAYFEGPEILKRLNVFEEVEHGGRVLFECQCKAHPMPAYKWYKDDVELVESDRMRIEDSLDIDGTLCLIINNVRKSDEGAYRCKLENQEGVAASTGYLSVTGNSSSSPNAVSTPPLLRAITEESNVSQDSDEGATTSSTTLEKILTGEYDVSALPYSQYLELLKESSGTIQPDADTILSPNAIEMNGGSRTPTEDTPHADDVKNLYADFSYVAPTMVAGDDDVNYSEDRFVTMATDETVMDALEIVNKPKSEVIFGTPLLSDSKTLFVAEGSRKEFSSDEVETDMWQNSVENPEEMAGEGLAGLSLEETRCEDYGYEVGVDLMVSDPLMVSDSRGDCVEDGAFDSLDEKKLKETVIAGRIGMPSDWEFAHYTDEASEDTSGSVPDNATANPYQIVETLRSKYEEEKEEVYEAEEMSASPLSSESVAPAAENRPNLEKKELSLMEAALLRNAMLDGNAQEPEDRGQVVDGRKEETVLVDPRNLDDSLTSSFLSEKTSSSVAEERVKGSDKSAGKDDFHVALSDPKESHSEVKREPTPESKPEGSPPKDGGTTSVANVGVSGQSTPVNSAIPDESDVRTLNQEATGFNGDGLVQPTEMAGFHFSNLISDLKPAAEAISRWIPDVSISSYIPDLSHVTGLSVGKPVDVEEIVAVVDEVAVAPVAVEEEVEPRSAIDWCVDWFRYPSIFYVLLVLTMTLVASATQMNPAVVVLVVAVCSLLGFRLFPVHGVQQE